MQRISVQEIKDYQTCARLYAYRYVDKLKESLDTRDRRALKFEDSVKKIAAFFFYKKQAALEPSYQALQNRWQKIWFGKEVKAAEIAVMRNEVAWMNDASYGSQAAASLLLFHENFANKKNQEVVLIDEEFIVPIGSDTCIVGTFDLVTRTKKNNGYYRYDVYKWVVSNYKRPSSFWLIDLAVLDYAIRERMKGKVADIRFHLWNFGSHIPGDKEIIVEKKDVDMLKYWVNQLYEDSTYVNRRGLTSYCKSCPFDIPCSNWTLK